jgi:hypothetical protein
MVSRATPMKKPSKREVAALHADIEEIVARIKPILAGRGGLLQGAVLNELVSTWIAGHAPELRDEILEVHVASVKALVPINAEIIRAKRLHNRCGDD